MPLSTKTANCTSCAYRTLEGMVVTRRRLFELLGSSCIHATHRAPKIVEFECKICGTRISPLTMTQTPRALCSCGFSHHHQYRKVFK